MYKETNEAKDMKIGADVFEETRGAKDLEIGADVHKETYGAKDLETGAASGENRLVDGHLVGQKRITSMEVYRCSISGVWVPPRYDIREFVPTAFLKGSPADQSSCFQTKTEMRIQDGLSSPNSRSNHECKWLLSTECVR